MKWSDQSNFKGEWYHDKRKKGTMKLKDGTVYTGCFQNDCFHGMGVLKIPM
jgi:hypothetical protein